MLTQPRWASVRSVQPRNAFKRPSGVSSCGSALDELCEGDERAHLHRTVQTPASQKIARPVTVRDHLTGMIRSELAWPYKTRPPTASLHGQRNRTEAQPGAGNPLLLKPSATLNKGLQSGKDQCGRAASIRSPLGGFVDSRNGNKLKEFGIIAAMRCLGFCCEILALVQLSDCALCLGFLCKVIIGTTARR